MSHCQYCCVAILILLVAVAQSSVYALPTFTSSVPISSNAAVSNESANGSEVQGKAYWIQRRSPDYTLLYITVPIAAGILLTVLVFFLWIFSSPPDSLQQYEYEQLSDNEEPRVVEGSLSQASPPSSSPTHPVVDQILDLPYNTNNPIDSSAEDHRPPSEV